MQKHCEKYSLDLIDQGYPLHTQEEFVKIHWYDSLLPVHPQKDGCFAGFLRIDEIGGKTLHKIYQTKPRSLQILACALSEMQREFVQKCQESCLS